MRNTATQLFAINDFIANQTVEKITKPPFHKKIDLNITQYLYIS